MNHLPLEIEPGQLKAALQNGSRPRLIDVREPHEYQICRLEGAELVPMRTVPQCLESLKQQAAEGPLVIYCHHGARSLQVVSWLRKQGLACCQSLSGGIDLWARLIDRSVPRY